MSAVPNNNLQEQLARYSSSKGISNDVIRPREVIKPKRFVFRNFGERPKNATTPSAAVGFIETSRGCGTTADEKDLFHNKGKHQKPKNILSFFNRTSTPLRVLDENKDERNAPSILGMDSEDDDFDLSSSFCMKKSFVADVAKNKTEVGKPRSDCENAREKDLTKENDDKVRSVTSLLARPKTPTTVKKENDHKLSTSRVSENFLLPDVVPRKAEGGPVTTSPTTATVSTTGAEADFWENDDDPADYIDIPTPSPVKEEILHLDDSDEELFRSDREEEEEEERVPGPPENRVKFESDGSNVIQKPPIIKSLSGESWREKNYEIMTKICDCVGRNVVILKQFPYIKNLVTQRLQIMEKMPTSPELAGKPVKPERTDADLTERPVKPERKPADRPSEMVSKVENFPLVKFDVSASSGGGVFRAKTDVTTPLNGTSSFQAAKEISCIDLSESIASTSGTSTGMCNGANTVHSRYFGEYDAAIFSSQYDCKKKNSGVAGKFIGNQHDDGASPRFKGTDFPHSRKLRHVFSEVFGLKEFRYNQLEAINAALLGEDCFILMPTGGGKSLCYQLPALVTQGVTIVISPLRSLIQDQVQKLQSLDVPAEHLSGEQDAGTVNGIYAKLARSVPGITLLYVTPEKVSASSKLISTFEQLFKRQMLSRFVIDEAHCVSQWGHDFRPDYKRLKALREKFPGVPMMALTATATPRVRLDILHQLGMTNPKWFLQSFNRPNLKYEVLPKKLKTVDGEIISLIKTKFQKKSGIVYCFSRRDCDQLAEVLSRENIKAVSYHAGLAGPDRTTVQEMWINDRVQVICATIAFGMGIDKPDVRFVIHQSLPKSVECFYQESGRAGRDGELSWCYLFYNYQDMHRMRRMVERDTQNFQAKQMHINNLHRMVQFCENRTDCRRVQMLQYFGEIFNKTFCHTRRGTSCDNCASSEVYECCDVTEDCKAILQCLSNMVGGRGKNYTLIYLVDVFKGSHIKKIEAAGHDKLPLHGRGQKYHRSDAERLLQKLVLEGFLREEMVITKLEHAVVYVHPGPRAADLLQGKIKVSFQLRQRTKPSDLAQADETSEDPESRELSERCYACLVDLSKEIGEKSGIHYTNVVNVKALRQMSRDMPMSESDMLLISHVTRAVYDKYGRQFLDITQRFGAERIVLEAEKADAMDQPFELEGRGGSEWMSKSGGRGQKRQKKSWGGKWGGAKRFKKGGEMAKRQPRNNKTSSAGASTSGKGRQQKTVGKKPTGLPPIPRKNLPGFLPGAKARSFLPAPQVFSA